MSRIEKSITVLAIILSIMLVEVAQAGHYTWEQLSLLPWTPKVSVTTAAFLAPFALIVLIWGMVGLIDMVVTMSKAMKAELVALVQAPAQRKIKLVASFGIMSWLIKVAFAADGKGQMAVGEAWATSLIMVGSMWLIIFTAASAYRAWHQQDEQSAN
jgi:hypothetical protein